MLHDIILSLYFCVVAENLPCYLVLKTKKVEGLSGSKSEVTVRVICDVSKFFVLPVFSRL